MLTVLKGRGGLVIRIILSVSLLGILAHYIGSSETISHLKVVSWQAVALAIAVLGASVVLVTPRWSVILFVLGYRISWKLLVESVLLGFLFNQLLPTAVGGDVVRAWRARQLGVPWEVSIRSVLLDRATGVLGSLLGSAFLLPFVGLYSVQKDLEWVVGAVAGLTLFGFIVLWLLARWQNVPTAFLGTVHGWIVRLHHSILAFFKNPVASAVILVLAFINQLLPVIAIGIFVHDLKVPLPMIDVAFIVFVSTLAATVPISFAGWGIREGTLVYLFGLYGIRPDAAFAVSILYGIALTLGAAPGLLFMLRGRAYLPGAEPK